MKEINLSEINGIKIGNAQNIKGATGCTVILCENGGTAGVDVRGGAPASRETELLKSENTVDKVHGIILSGGSAYGLDAAAGVMQYLEEKEKGFSVKTGVVPIVCGASLFDLIVGDSKCRPDKKMGYEACLNSEKNEIKEGNIGAGTGASVGKIRGVERAMKGGLGIYAVQLGELKVGAIVAVNALGDIIDIDTNEIIAGLLNEEKNCLASTEEEIYSQYENVSKNIFNGNTTIGCIVTNAKLTKSQMNKLASISHNGYAKAISPVHTTVDGDTIFTITTDEIEVMPDAVGILATKVMSKAINRAVLNAESSYNLKSAKEMRKKLK
ncbi:P1 family peptidase [Fusobacterium sp. MFO224]|uniref:P1 family peptidase n=1 Tax=Fusobacterium sp. MFO224 TaxID=3378070 RepID=UPI0038529C1B